MLSTRNRVVARGVAVVIVAVMVAAVGLTACGSDKKKDNTTSGSGGAKTSGKTLVIGTSADFPPMLSKATSGELEGFEVDMVKDVMGRVGRKYKFQQLQFAGLLPALQSGRIDLIVSDMYATAERKKVVDFVPYAQSSLGILVGKANKGSVTGFTDLCGKTVGALIGSPPEVTELEQKSGECTGGGKAAITISKYQSVAQELSDIDNGRLFASFEDIVTLGNVQHKTGDKYSLEFVDPAFLQIGMAIKKTDALKSKLQSALTAYTSSAAYKTTAKKWGLPDQSLL